MQYHTQQREDEREEEACSALFLLHSWLYVDKNVVLFLQIPYLLGFSSVRGNVIDRRSYAIIDAAVNSEASFCVLDAPIRATAAAFPRIPSRCNCADGEFCFDGSSSSGFLLG